MTGPLDSRIKTIFMDEFHDLYSPYPGRQQVWNEACIAISQMGKQRVFTSATHPPHLNDLFHKKAYIFQMEQFPMQVIRASTDRRELAHYVLNLPPPKPSVGKKITL